MASQDTRVSTRAQEDAVRNTIRNVVVPSHTEARNVLDSISRQVLDLAILMVDAEHMDKVGGLREQYAQVAALLHEVAAHKHAVEELGLTYQAPEQAETNFTAALEQAIGRQPKFNPARSDVLRMFDQETGWKAERAEGAAAVPGEGDAIAGDDSEDLEVVGGTNERFKNLKCPYTLKPVMELYEPVEDDHGIVYEKEAVMDALKRNQTRHGSGALPCPLAGCSHSITVAMLKPSKVVQREKRRLLMQGATQGGASGAQADAAEDDVFDVDELR